MRVTNVSVTRNYLTGLHSNRALLNKYSNQTITGQRFTNLAEDPASGVRALQVRRAMSRNASYQENVSAAKSQLASAETTMKQAVTLTHSINELFIQGANGTYEGDREAIITQVEKLQQELLTLANGKFSDKYMFGGTNTTSPPFTLDKDNDLCYNGYKVKDIDANTDAALFNDANYIDIGLGLKFNPAGSQNVDPNSAYKNTIVGLDFMGHGSENIYLLISDMQDMLSASPFDAEAAGKVLDRFQTASAKMITELTKLGSDDNFLDFNKNRLEEEKLNLVERQEAIEVIEPDEAIMNWKMQEYVYNAALQMGSRLLQSTLFDYIR